MSRLFGTYNEAVYFVALASRKVSIRRKSVFILNERRRIVKNIIEV